MSSADLLLRAGRIHTLVPGEPPQRALAVRGDRVYAVAAAPEGLDHLIGPATTVLDLPGATVLPAFDDTHTHLIAAGDSAQDVSVDGARSIAELLDLIRARADRTPPGEWIRTAGHWQELNLAERRFPTAAELDTATDQHPVLVLRGVHNQVLNGVALRRCGIDATTPDPAGGAVTRDPAGQPTGHLRGGLALIRPHLPVPDQRAKLDGLRLASHAYAATGIGTVRDTNSSLADLAALRQLREEGGLGCRVRVLLSTLGFSSRHQVEELLDGMEPWRHLGDPWLGVWGVKFWMDGGIEAGALETPYCPAHCPTPGYTGQLAWEEAELQSAVELVARRGWRVGIHAYGDRGVRTLLDLYERVQGRLPGLPYGTLVMEHGGLADEIQRRRAVALGIPITIQQPLLHDAAAIQTEYWGEDRVAALFPARAWLDAGADLSAGSDYPVGAFGAAHSLHGLTTRTTVAGVLGPAQTITRAEALALHTTAATRLTHETHLRGTLTPGRLADLTIWPADPTTTPTEALATLLPTHTFLGGTPVHAPQA
ncbi:Amidohydrolase 3 [Kitasatospora sp. MMS16-BH015]|uniref:amidohydrolase n=1 Tax=Kitasatospora sp. MMS16-BH015 TaxID=2018025 RepID=UPI000CA21DDA|nr:amidohydrolase [Kitasatospora sp. MMS16-BH015]AUG76263.1 Amidohydrolase 3 [Kitasatospora sp. MMS16-BH015]